MSQILFDMRSWPSDLGATAGISALENNEAMLFKNSVMTGQTGAWQSSGEHSSAQLPKELSPSRTLLHVIFCSLPRHCRS